MKMKSAWGNKLVACLTAAAMVVSSLAIPTVNVSAKETDDIAAETAEVSEAEAVAKAYYAATNTTKFYDRVQDAIDSVTTAEGVVLSKDNVVTLLKDQEKDITIKYSVTLDLNGKTIKGVQDGFEDHHFGPLYLQNNKIDDANKNTIYIKNGIVIAEIDGAPGFNTDNNGQNEIYYTGDVVLEDITLKPYMIGETADVSAVVWTDGHDFTLIGCDFSNATIQNINSIVTIKSGTYKALTKYGTQEDTYNVDGDRTFKLMGGSYDKDVPIGDYLASTDYTADTSDSTYNKVVAPSLDSVKTSAKTLIDSLVYVTDAEKTTYKGQIDQSTSNDEILAVLRDAAQKELTRKAEEAKTIIQNLVFVEAPEEQQGFQDQIDNLVTDWYNRINSEDDTAAKIEHDINRCKEEIDGKLNDAYQKAHLKTLSDSRTQAKEIIEALPNLTTDEKTAYKEAVDQAGSTEQVTGIVKDAAKEAINREAANADAEIDGLTGLNDTQKDGFKGNVATEKEGAHAAIDAVGTETMEAIQTAVTDGVTAIKNVVDAAKAAQGSTPSGTQKPGATLTKGTTGHSITIVAAEGVEYALDKDNGPWYRYENGMWNKETSSGTIVPLPNNKDESSGVFMTGTDTITFTKTTGGADLDKATEYSIYSRYTSKAVAQDSDKSRDVVDTKFSTSSSDARDIAEAFVKNDDSTTTSGNGKDEKAENAKVVVTVNANNDGYIVTLKQDLAGTITIPDTWGNVMIDLNGHDIIGPDGTQEAPAGKQAVVLEDTDKEGTHLTVEDNSADKGGEIKGGNAYAGSGADGGDAIVVEEKNNNGTNSTLDIGDGVKVIGGNGADSNTDNGGNGGDAVDGNVEKNDGTLIGGNGGATDAKDKEGGNGGNGANGDITENNGVITGGNGGSSTNAGGGNGGDGADGVNGDVTKNNGTITGGNGGNSDNKTGGTGGDGVNGNVTDNTNSGTISGGNGGDSKNENGGNGGNGVDGTVGKNEGTISGGDGGDATGNGGNGGNGGSGTTGNVGENNGTIGGGNGGNSANGTGGNGGSGSNGTTGGSGAIKPGNNGTGESNPDGGNKMPAGLSPEEAEIWKNSESLESVEKSILNADTDKGDVKGSSFSRLRLRAIGKNKAIQLKWKKQSKADGYIIYGSACGSKMKKLKTIKKAATTSWTKKKLKKGKYYKYMVVAYKTIGKEKRVIAKSIGVHAVTKGGKYGNPEKVVIRSKKKLTLKKGKTAKIKATYTSKKKVRTHIRIVRFESSNKKVATVSKTGKIKAKKKGKCTIYVYAQNGIYKTVKVTVK